MTNGNEFAPCSPHLDAPLASKDGMIDGSLKRRFINIGEAVLHQYRTGAPWRD
jgi:hypothetical protein